MCIIYVCVLIRNLFLVKGFFLRKKKLKQIWMCLFSTCLGIYDIQCVFFFVCSDLSLEFMLYQVRHYLHTSFAFAVSFVMFSYVFMFPVSVFICSCSTFMCLDNIAYEL